MSWLVLQGSRCFQQLVQRTLLNTLGDAGILASKLPLVKKGLMRTNPHPTPLQHHAPPVYITSRRASRRNYATRSHEPHVAEQWDTRLDNTLQKEHREKVLQMQRQRIIE
jgi:hypothetical protein